MDEIAVLGDLAAREPALLELADEFGEPDHRIQGRAEFMAHIGDEFGFDLVCEFGLDAGRVFCLACPLAEHGVREQGGILAHQGATRARG